MKSINPWNRKLLDSVCRFTFSVSQFLYLCVSLIHVLFSHCLQHFYWNVHFLLHNRIIFVWYKFIMFVQTRFKCKDLHYFVHTYNDSSRACEKECDASENPLTNSQFKVVRNCNKIYDFIRKNNNNFIPIESVRRWWERKSFSSVSQLCG